MKTPLFFSLAFALFFSLSIAMAATCQKTGSVCVDSTPGKSINGATVTLAQVGGCWQYQDTYSCLKPDAVDYCTAIESLPGCSQIDSTCIVNDTTFGAGCMQWTNTWQCGTGLATPVNTVVLDTSYTITTDILDSAACASYASNPSCRIAAHTCTDPAATRIINGLPVYKDCWAWQDSYSCVGSLKSDCAALQARGCTLSTSSCLKNAVNGACSLTEDVYQCPDSAGSTSSVLDCGGQQYCMGGNCFNTGSPVPNSDFAQTAAMMEAMREAGNYMDPATLRIFGGTGGSCTKVLFGLANCCKPSGGGAVLNNATVMGYAVQNGISAGGQAIKYGSSYMFDTLYDNSEMLRGLSSSLNSSTGILLNGNSAMGFNPSFGLYGFTASFGAAPAGATVLGSAGGFTFAFDPTTLAIAVAIMVIEDVLSCTQDEQKLSMRLGQNLCRFTGSSCTTEIPIIGVCLAVTETYCCFNSRLARIINTAGGAQIGKAVSDCSGFTTAEFATLDFSKMDLSEFTSEIMANVHLPSTSAVNSDATATMQNKLNNYYTRGKQ
jgi:conjugal transfer mating pair stabilization protein TraN